MKSYLIIKRERKLTEPKGLHVYGPHTLTKQASVNESPEAHQTPNAHSARSRLCRRRARGRACAHDLPPWEISFAEHERPGVEIPVPGLANPKDERTLRESIDQRLAVAVVVQGFIHSGSSGTPPATFPPNATQVSSNQPGLRPQDRGHLMDIPRPNEARRRRRRRILIASALRVRLYGGLAGQTGHIRLPVLYPGTVSAVHLREGGATLTFRKIRWYPDERWR